MLARTIALAASVLLFGGNTIHAQNGAKTAAPATDAAGQAAPGQNAVEGLDVSTESGKVILKLKLKDPMANVPASFSLANPPRVAFDFPNTVNALGKTAQDVNENDVKSVRIGESGGRTRVVLNLNRSLKYSAALEGQNVVITLMAAGATAFPRPRPSLRTLRTPSRRASHIVSATSTSSAGAMEKARW